MRQAGIRDEGESSPVTRAEQLGWDDSLYDDAPRRPGAAGTATEAGGRVAGGDSETDGESEDESESDKRAVAGGGGNDGPVADREAGHGGVPPARPRRTWARALRWTALAVALLLLTGAGAGYLYLRHLDGNLTKEDLNLGDRQLDKAPPNADGQTPLNILLLGSDSRASEENIALGGSRADADRKPLADSQMLVHISADRSHMTALSIPRDTRVTTPQCTDPADGTVYPETDSRTINRSLQNGGPGCTVATWEHLTGIPIDHFMMVDFAGVVSMADAVGGVPVCVRDNVHDHRSGLRLPAGTSTIRGEQALQWLRTRYGFENGSDIGRNKAHQMYFTSMIRELQEGTKLSEPTQLHRLAEAATNALTVDSGLGSVTRLYDLGEDLRRVPTDGITMVTLPWEPDPRNPTAHVVPLEAEAERIFTLIRNDIPLDDEEALADALEEADEKEAALAGPREQIAVTVRNGTGTSALPPVTGRAGAVTDALHGLGFTRAVTDNTPAAQADTTLSYPSDDHRPEALALARELGLPRSALRTAQGTTGLVLVIGADWREGVSYPVQREPLPPADRGRDTEGTTGGEGDGEGAGEDGGILDRTESVTGDDTSACMEVNPAYTW
ncbi:LCP family protein [Streptomyces sodiiphilus]|uniref:LCP family protein n=1 Tax=Streptomyces sodiiphilus TaxID=226217 RepID=A0ABN2PN29_9ACTN